MFKDKYYYQSLDNLDGYSYQRSNHHVRNFRHTHRESDRFNNFIQKGEAAIKRNNGKLPGNIRSYFGTAVSAENIDAIRLTFNVGGVIFETYQNTLINSQFLNNHDIEAHYDSIRNEYFFDRDPEVFRCVLNYWRTGKLHLPHGRCGPSLCDELELWGLEEIDIQPCCWHSYNNGIETSASLERLRRDAIQDEETKSTVDIRPKNKCCKFRLNVWYLLTSPSHSRVAKVYEYVAIFFAIVAIFSFCASTSSLFQISVPKPGNDTTDETAASQDLQEVSNSKSRRSSRVSPVLVVIDYFCVAFFSVEFIILALCSPHLRKFMCSITAVIDVLAVLPDYIEFVLESASKGGNASAVTDLLLLLRLMRVIRIFRVIRRISGLWIMIYTLKASYKDLFLMLLFLLVGTLLFGSVIFFVDDPDIFTSIPQSFWWAIVTMTTVGYGDMVPTTPWGQLVGSVTTVCGVLLIGFTIPSLVNNFTVYYNLVQFDARQKNC